jgi:hypothetical protein
VSVEHTAVTLCTAVSVEHTAVTDFVQQ